MPKGPTVADRRTVTIAEAAELSGLSEQAIRRRIERGQLPVEKVERNRRRIALADLARLGLLRDQPAPPAERGDVDGALDRLTRQVDELRAAVAEVRAEVA